MSDDRNEIRKAVLRFLRKNARMSEAEMADRINVTAEEVAGCIKELEEDGTVIGYCALVNEDNFENPPVRAIIEVEVQPERDDGFDRLAAGISRFRQVKSVHLVSGRYDLRLEVADETLQMVATFVSSKLAPLDGVKSTVTHFLLKKYKEAGFRFQEDEGYERLKIVP